MFVKNLVTEFYNVILDKKVLILVNFDVDAICAAKILQGILNQDSIAVLIPVSTVTDLMDAYKAHINDIKNVILINCGGTIDIIETLTPVEDVVFFIADSHRPTALSNVYEYQEQVRLLSEHEVPAFEDIFRENETGNKQNDEEIDNEEFMRRRDWEANRERILSDYVQFSYYGRSSAIIMFELSWLLHGDNVDNLLWGIVGVVEQFLLDKVKFKSYLNEVKILSSHVGRLFPNTSDVYSPATLRINCEKDLQLALYRHWTIESSIRYTILTAVALQPWASKEGDRQMHRMFAEMGLPLAASRQPYNYMDLTLRRELLSMMKRMSNSRNLPHIIYPSFNLIRSSCTKYQAADYVYSLLAILSEGARARSKNDRFFEALNTLSSFRTKGIDDGIEKSKKFLRVMFQQVGNALNKLVTSAGSFFYVVILEDTVDAEYFSTPDCLSLMANFTLRAASLSLPLLVSAPLGDDYCLIVGVPPVAETAPRSFFGQAFERVAESTGCNIFNDYSDPTVVRVLVADRPKIFESLAVILS